MRKRHRLIVLALAAGTVTSCGSGVVATVAVETTSPSTSSSVTTTSVTSTVQSVTTTTVVETTTTTELTAESLGDGRALAAKTDAVLDVYQSPEASEPFATLSEQTELGTIRVVLVLEGPHDGWMRVSLPVRPNGSEGWVRASDVELFVVDRRVEVDLSDRQLVVSDSDGVLLETAVAVGGANSPTPTGSFFITDSVILGDAAGPWGPHAFGLSAHSDTVTEFNGGDGIIGIHGTNQPSSIGHARSLGCVRVPNDVALVLADLLSAGVPVEIRE